MAPNSGMRARKLCPPGNSSLPRDWEGCSAENTLQTQSVLGTERVPRAGGDCGLGLRLPRALECHPQERPRRQPDPGASEGCDVPTGRGKQESSGQQEERKMSWRCGRGGTMRRELKIDWKSRVGGNRKLQAPLPLPTSTTDTVTRAMAYRHSPKSTQSTGNAPQPMFSQGPY